MNAMSVAGRRGEINWGKAGRQYDTFVVSFGIMVPFMLGDCVHIWDIPTTTVSGGCKAIRLRPDPRMKWRILLGDWAVMSSIGLVIGAPFACGGVHWGLGVALSVPALPLLAVGIYLMWQNPRDRTIRLVLGRHAWGSSDPAHWGKSIRKDIVDPKAALGVKSFAALAKKAMAKEDWCTAMWAARLCVAAENADLGEELTDTILAEADVQDRLAAVRRDPQQHKREFGKAPPLQQWLRCDPELHILEID